MSSPAMPYVGSRISLISKAEIRYEGILYVINTEESTIALQNVRSYGTEGRAKPDVPPTDEVYDFIIFRGEDMKDLTVLEGSSTKPSQRAVLEDPAVVSVGPERKVVSSNVRENARDSGRDNTRRDQRGYPERRDYGRDDRHHNQVRGKGQSGKGQSGSGQNSYNQGGHGQSSYSRPYEKKWDQPQRNDRDFRSGPPRAAGVKGYGKSNSARRPNNDSSKLSIGELTANENPQTKAEVGEEFDFSSANTKFEKPSDVKEADDTRAGYSKTKSFFDDISCDALERSAGKGAGSFDRNSREKQREVDKETFGASAANSRPFGYGHRRYNRNGKGSGKAQRAF